MIDSKRTYGGSPGAMTYFQTYFTRPCLLKIIETRHPLFDLGGQIDTVIYPDPRGPIGWQPHRSSADDHEPVLTGILGWIPERGSLSCGNGGQRAFGQLAALAGIKPLDFELSFRGREVEFG